MFAYAQIRQVWINSYSEVALAQFRLLSDFLQVTALQALIPARESQWFVVRKRIVCVHPAAVREVDCVYVFVSLKMVGGCVTFCDVVCVCVCVFESGWAAELDWRCGGGWIRDPNLAALPLCHLSS